MSSVRFLQLLPQDYSPLQRTLVLLALLLFGANGLGQPKLTPPENLSDISEAKRYYLKVNPFPILAGPIPTTSEYRLGLEVVANENISYQLSGSLLTKSVLIGAFANDSLKQLLDQLEYPGFRFQLQARRYLLKFDDQTLKEKMSPNGIYVAAHLSFARAVLKSVNQNYPQQEWTNLTLNALVGTQMLSSGGFGLDAFFGLGYKDNTVLFTDYRMREREIDLRDEYEGALGAYLAAPIKVTLGFHLTFGLM